MSRKLDEHTLPFNILHKYESEKCETTLYMFKAEHQVIILSSLPRVIVDDESPPTMDVGRLPRDADVELWRSVAILPKPNRCPASGIRCFSTQYSIFQK